MKTTMINSVRSILLMFTPQRELAQDDSKRKNRGQPPSAVSGSRSPAPPLGFCETGEPENRSHWVSAFRPSSVLPYGIGLGPGTGATPQMAAGQGGSGDGVGIRKLLPCLDGEQLGSVAGLHVMQAPV